MQQRSEETRTRIIQSATERFSLKGYETTSVADICAQAGVSKGAFFHHFATKQAVFLAVLESWLSDLDGQLMALMRSSDSVSQGLVSMTNLTPLIFNAANNQLTIFLEFWSQSCRDPEVWSTTIEPYRRYAQMFAAFLRAGMHEGSLRQVEADTASRVLMALLIGLLLQGMMDPKAADWNKVTREGVQILMEGLQRRSE